MYEKLENAKINEKPEYLNFLQLSGYRPKLFKLMIKAWNFATTLMTLRLTFSDIGSVQINFWWREPCMLETG